MGKRRGRRIHCPSRLTAPKRKSTMHAVSILGIPTSGSNTTPITSVRECTQAGIGNIAQVTSVSQRTQVVIALSAIEGLPIVSTHNLAFQASPQVDRKHSHTQLSCRSRSPHSLRHTRWTHHAQHSPSSLTAHPAACLRTAPTLTQTHLPVQSDATTATDPSIILTTGGIRIGIDIHLRTAG